MSAVGSQGNENISPCHECLQYWNSFA